MALIEVFSIQSSQLERAAAQLDQGGGPTGAVVCTGDIISVDSQDGAFLRGHGTQADSEDLRATQCGVVQRVNKLISVRPLQQRYTAELGDVVVGRVIEIANKRWKLDLHSFQEASLMLSAVNLPGGVQRRRTVEDELNMRTVFREGDLISAEIQQLYGDGSVALHTRSAKYGKLQQGQLLYVPSGLVPRQKRHFSSMAEHGVDLILGVNGMVWVTRAGQLEAAEGDRRQLLRQELEAIARAANAIRALAKNQLTVTPAKIEAVIQRSRTLQVECSAMLEEKFLSSVITDEAKRRREYADE